MTENYYFASYEWNPYPGSAHVSKYKVCSESKRPEFFLAETNQACKMSFGGEVEDFLFLLNDETT